MLDTFKLDTLACTREHVKLLSKISTSAAMGKVLRMDGLPNARTVMLHSVAIKQTKCPS